MPKNIVVTGSNGFIGKNLKVALNHNEKFEVHEINRSTKEENYEKILANTDIVYHLAGVNRPKNEKEFFDGNVGLTKKILQALPEDGCKFVFSSSIHAQKNNAYGKSKKLAEEAIELATKKGKVESYIYRLPGVFGKWCKPNYNSVVATFCHNVARDKDIIIDDSSARVSLVYIDDIIESFEKLVDSPIEYGKINRKKIKPVYEVTVGKLAEKIRKFKFIRPNLYLPNVEDKFEKKLYSTYLSYLPNDEFSYDLDVYEDDRGWLFEWIKSEAFGQVFISSTEPGITRGNHFHYSKTEKFLVIKGNAEILFRDVNSDKVIQYKVSGKSPEVVDIPPGYTHNLTNVGSEELITLFWANEIFDQENPDTNYEEV